MNGRILPDQTQPSYEQLKAAYLQKCEEAEALKAAVVTNSNITFKITDKGCVSVRGLTNPMYSPSLYPKVWKGILKVAKELDAFIDRGLADGSLSLEKRS